MRCEIVLVFLFCGFNRAGKFHLPEKLGRCHLSDPNLDECLNKAIYNAIRFIGSKGIPSLGLPSVDPIEIKEYHIQGDTFSQHYYDSKLYGYLDAKVTDAHLDMEKKTLKFTTFSDYTQIAHYNLTGKMLQIPVTGDGESSLKTLGTTGVHILKFREKLEGGKIFWVVDDYYLKMDNSGAVIDYKNLFNGNKLLADNILKVMNENWKEVSDILKDGIEKAYKVVLKSMANRVFEKVPIDEIFPK